MSKQNSGGFDQAKHQKPFHQNLMATVRAIKIKVPFHHLVKMLAM